MRLAKEADPTGERTIGQLKRLYKRFCLVYFYPLGVLTKPDTVLSTSVGQLQKWRDVLEGNSNVLKHGYYCVRLPDEAERLKKLSREETQGLAERFFRESSPWNEIKNRGRLGIPNLVLDISALLVRWIERK